VAVVTVTATAVAPGDVKRNLCDQNGIQLQLMMTDHLTDTVMQIHTEFHPVTALQKNQVLTVEDPLVRCIF